MGPVVRSVLHVAQPTTEGVARCVADLAALQERHGWRVAVASPAEGDLPGWASAAAARHLSWSASRSPGPGLGAEVVSLRRLIRNLRPDIVHLHSAKAGLAGRLALRGRLPTIFQPHAWSFLAVRGPISRAALRWERSATRWATAIVCVSEAEREQGAEAGIDGRWFVVPNGVDLDRFSPRDRASARSSLGVGDGPLVVCIGRLSRQKGQDVLLRAWTQASRRVPDARLVLVGDGPEASALRAAASTGVAFAGVSQEVPAWLAAADVVAIPSRWEGMSLAMLEALACGRSLVVSDVPGAREAVTGEVGEVVPVEDPAALAAALVRRLEDPSLRDREGLAARRVAEERFGLERTGDAVIAVYNNVLRDVSS